MSVALPKEIRRPALHPAEAEHEGAHHHDHAHAHAHESLAPHGGRYADVLDAIGHTPLVEVPRMSPNPDAFPK